MRRFLYSTSLLLAGVLLGWWLHELQTPGTAAPLAGNSSGPAHPPAAIPTVTSSLPGRARPPAAVTPAADTVVTAQRFRQLLEQQEFERAVAYYDRATMLDGGHHMLLKPVLENYLQACLRRCSAGVFVDLVEAWLGSYYEDIPVLLLLAEYQREQGLPEEAARVLHMAMTYAYKPGQRERVKRALRQLVTYTDTYLSEQQRWIELLAFYELLEAIAMSEPVFALRQAAIYRRVGEVERELLQALRSGTDELDPQQTRTLEEQLAGMTTEPEPETAPVDALPVSRLGDHFLVEATLNQRERVVLMIDTGASVTSLSRTSFERLGGTRFTPMGSQLFKTANGLAQGEVFQAESITLGENRLHGIEVAILEFASPDGADGLLGMNVLRHFRFDLDQDRALLYLEPRL